MRSARSHASNRGLHRVVCLLPVACCLLLVGCNNGRQLQADLYQRELRLQEDEIYRLEDNLEEYQAIVRGYRCEVADLKRELANTQSDSVSGPVHGPPTIVPVDGPEFSPSGSEPNQLPSVSEGESEEDDEPFPAPDAEEAPPFMPGANRTAPPSEATATLAQHKSPLPKKAILATKKKLDEVDPPLPFSPTQAPPIAESTAEPKLSVQSESVQPLHANPLASDSPATRPSSNRRIATFIEPATLKATPKKRATPLLKLATVDSVRVDLQNGPRESTGELTLLAKLVPLSNGEVAYFEGEASVLLADMSRRGTRRRIGRWDFSANEVALAWSQGSAELELPLLLPAELISKTPTDRPLRLWIRLVDRRGRKTLHSIDVDFLDRPWRLAETRPAGLIPAHPIKMAISVESNDLTGKLKKEPITVSTQSGWRRAVLHRSSTKSAPKRDDAVRPATYTSPTETTSP